MSPLQNGSMDIPEAPDAGVSNIVDSVTSDTTGSTAEPVSKPTDPFKTISANLQMGQAQVQQQYQNLDTLNNPNLTDEQVRQTMASGPASKVVTTGTSYQGEPWYVRGAADAAQMEPGMEDMAKQGAIGWGAGVAADVAAGPAYAAATATGVGAIPAAIVGATLPAVGWTLGSANAAWHQSAGQLAGDLMQNQDMAKAGVNRDTIRNISYSFGAVNAALQMVGINAARGMAGRALSTAETGMISKVLTSSAVTKVITNQAGRIGVKYLTSVTEQAGVAAATTLVGSMAKMTIAMLRHQKADIYQSWPDTIKATYEAFTHALSGAAIITAGAGVAGAAVGAGKGAAKGSIQNGKEILQRTSGKSPQQLMDMVTAHLKEADLEPGKLEINEQGQVTFNEHPKEVNPLDTLFGEVTKELRANTPEAPEVDKGRVLAPEDKTQELTAELAQARLDMIDHDVRLMDREVNLLHTEASRREKSGLPMTAIINKLNKINHTIQTLQHEGHMIEAGLLTVPGEGGAWGKVKLAKLNAIFKTLHADAVKAEGMGRENVAILQDKLEQTVRALTPDKTIRAAVRQYINGVTTPKQMQTAIRTIHEKVIKMEEGKIAAENLEQSKVLYDKTLKLLKGNAVKLSNGKPTSNLPPDITASLQTLRGFLKDGKTIDAYLDDFNSRHGDHLDNREWDKIPVDELAKFNLATQAGRILHGSVEARLHAASQLADLIANGKAEIQAKRDTAKAQAEKDVAGFKAVTGLKEGQPRSGKAANENKVQHLWRTGKARMKQFVDVIDFVSPNDKDKAFRIGNLDSTESRHNYEIKRTISALAFHASLKTSLQKEGLTMTDGEIQQRMYDGNRNSYKVTYNDKNGKAVSITLTKNEMLDVWLKAHNVNEHANLEKGNGYTLTGENSTLSVIGNYLDAKDKALGQGILDFYDHKYNADVNPFYRVKANIDLPKQENYTPSPKKGASKKIDASAKQFQPSTHIPSSAKARQTNAHAINIQDPFQAANQYSNTWDYNITHDRLLTTMQNVFHNGDIRGHIEDTYGAGTNQVIDNGIDKFIANSPMQGNDKNGILGALRADASMHTLGFKWGNSVITHLTSMTAMVADDGVGSTLKSGVEAATNPGQTVATMKKIWNSPIVTSRRHEGPAADLQGIVRNQQVMGHTLSALTGVDLSADSPGAAQLFNRLAFAGISYGDSAKAAIGGTIVYNTAIRNGATPHEAIIMVERRLEQTQQGTGPGALPDFYSQHPLVHTMMGMFQNEHTQLTGQLDTAVNDFGNSPKKPGDIATLARKAVMISLVPALAAGVQRSLPMLTSSDDRKQKEGAYGVLGEILTQPVQGYPGLNVLAEKAWLLSSEAAIGADQSKAAKHVGESNIVLSTFLDSVVDAGNAIHDMTKQNKNTSPFSISKTDKTGLGERAAYKVGAAATGVLGIPGMATGAPIDAMTALRQGDPLGAMYAGIGMPHGGIAAREHKDPKQSLEQSLFGTPKPKGALDPAWHFMKSYLGGQQPQKDLSHDQDFMQQYLKDL